MTDGTGAVENYTFDEIRQLKIDNGAGVETFGELNIPSLEEVLMLCKEADSIPIIEIKGGEVEQMASLKELLDEYEMSDTAVIISFNERCLEEYRRLDKDIEIFYLMNSLTKEDVDWCIENNFGINFNCWLLYKNFSAIRYARDNGLEIAAWTVDNPLFADIMVFVAGAEYITTNKILP
jgi:glycerophosphoryl diester phosphodiesterase